MLGARRGRSPRPLAPSTRSKPRLHVNTLANCASAKNGTMKHLATNFWHCLRDALCIPVARMSSQKKHRITFAPPACSIVKSRYSNPRRRTARSMCAINASLPPSRRRKNFLELQSFPIAVDRWTGLTCRQDTKSLSGNLPDVSLVLITNCNPHDKTCPRNYPPYRRVTRLVTETDPLPRTPMRSLLASHRLRTQPVRTPKLQARSPLEPLDG